MVSCIGLFYRSHLTYTANLQLRAPLDVVFHSFVRGCMHVEEVGCCERDIELVSFMGLIYRSPLTYAANLQLRSPLDVVFHSFVRGCVHVEEVGCCERDRQSRSEREKEGGGERKGERTIVSA